MNAEVYIQKMTLEEKAAMLQGWTTWTTRDIKRLEIPAIFLSDGPTGLRKQEGSADHLGLNASVPATCFPTSATVANTWDPALAEACGRALGVEAASHDVNVVLGPGVNMKRSPLCGRNFEYYSEDPYLAGKMAAGFVRGIQASGVAACPKHFAVNSQETRRMAMDSVVDERTLREIYLTAFEIAVKEAKAKTIMTSYNMVNGVYANESAHLLTDILKKEWGFDGFVMTDWGGDNDHVEGVRAGSALVMPAPGPNCAADLVDAVQAGKIPESALDDRIREILGVVFDTTEAVSKAPKTFDVDAHHAIARNCAAQGIVLLENDGILPLSAETKVAVIGDFGVNPRYQGAGSSQVNPTRMENLKDSLEANGVTVTATAQGFDRKNPNPRQDLIDEAVTAAKTGDVVLLCVGLDDIAESEGLDRTTMNMSRSQYALIDAVSAVSKHVVLVLSGGSPFVMPENTKFRAAIHGYLGGQAGGAAMADAILGKVNPSGKLNETWPASLEENPSYPYYPSKERTAEHREGLYIGYRYYDTAGVPVRYPFGYGLSYTTFAYSDLQADVKTVTFTVTNTGKVAGAEVAQVYVSCPGGKIYRPKKELKGFAKVFLEPGESKTVTVELDDKAFRYFNTTTNHWEVETADYEIHVAANVSDVKLSATVHVEGTNAPLPADVPACYRSGKIMNVSDEEFEALLGHPIPDGTWGGEFQANDAFAQLYYAKSAPARWLGNLLKSMKEKADAKGVPDLNIHFIYNMPIRATAKMAGGMVDMKMVDDIVFLINGHFWRGLGRIIVDFFKNMARNNAFLKKLEQGPEA